MNEYIEFKEEYPFIEWNNQFLMEYSIFCESDDNLTGDIEESAPGLYEQWLKLHDYDPKTNAERSHERKERGELPRKQKKQAKKQNVVKEYMI